MKIFHLADLHIGKVVNGFSMIEDQRHVLWQILSLMDEEKPQALLIAGDVYDKAIPSAEAVRVLDGFLFELTQRGVAVLIISGNHDSPERLSFGGRMLEKSQLYLAPVLSKELRQVSLFDEHGEVRFTLLPFIKPRHVQNVFAKERVETYTDAVQIALSHAPIDPQVRNVLLTHQFVTGGSRSDSETLSIGGSDNVDACVFAAFDYVALGHLHAPQKMSRDTICYAGSPLKYSFSECTHHKSVTVLELFEKGNTVVRTLPLTPLHEMRKIKGAYLDIMKNALIEGHLDDYVDITLTDENDVIDGLQKLRTRYAHLMSLSYDNLRTKGGALLKPLEALTTQTPLALFEDFYQNRNHQPLSERQRAYLQAKMEEIWEGDV